jgi:inosine triphosphate pyrophosphatase
MTKLRDGPLLTCRPTSRAPTNHPRAFIFDIRLRRSLSRNEINDNKMAPPKQLNFITGNKNKLLESQAILGDLVDLRNQPLDLVEIQGTIEEIIKDKCRRAADAVC